MQIHFSRVFDEIARSERRSDRAISLFEKIILHSCKTCSVSQSLTGKGMAVTSLSEKMIRQTLILCRSLSLAKQPVQFIKEVLFGQREMSQRILHAVVHPTRIADITTVRFTVCL